MHAALELFAQNGFEQTTAAEIAARAGVTERTFFRHFPDKREVLFEGQHILVEGLTAAIAAAPPDLPPMAVLRRAFAAVTPMFETNRSFSAPRQRVIAASPALQEREAAKGAAITRAVADALQKRGIERPRAMLAAQAGSAVLSHAFDSWVADPSQSLDAWFDRAFEELQDLTAPS